MDPIKIGVSRPRLLQILWLALLLTTAEAFARVSNTTPTITDIPDQTIAVSTDTGLLGFTIGDAETATDLLRLTTDSTDQRLVPLSRISIALVGRGPGYTVKVTPTRGLAGQCTVTITVTDAGGLSAGDQFLVVVNQPNTAPTIDRIQDSSILEDSLAQSINLTGITSGAENAIQTLRVTATSSNPNLIPDPSLTYTSPNSTGKLSFAPLADANGTATITVSVDDGGTANSTKSTTFVVSVSSVNDAPSFRAGGNQSVNEDAGAQRVAGWALGMSAGPADEAAQVLDFVVSNSNSALFSAQPAVSSSGTLIYTPASNASGAAAVTVQLHDNGGVADGGADTSAAQTFTITVNPVNDPPTLGPISNVSLSDGTSAQTVSLTGISSGAANENQTLTVTASSSNKALISDPVVSYVSPNAAGSLALAAAPNTGGTAIITVTVNDGGGANNVFSRTFSVSFNAVNKPPTIGTLANLVLNEDDPAKGVAIAGISSGSGVESQILAITATSSNPSLIPHPSISYTSPAATGSLSLKPAPNANGTAVITVSVDDGGPVNNIVSTAFTVTVSPVNDPPTLSDIPNQTANQDSTVAPISFTVGDIDSALTALSVTGKSSNQVLVPNANITMGGSGASRTLSIRLAPGQSGSTTVTFDVNDGSASATDTFLLTVIKKASPPLITTHPGSQTVDEGDSITFVVAASGDPTLTYQWRRNEVPLSAQTDVRLGLANVQLNQSGNYDVVVTNPNGSTTSNPALLTVQPVELDFGDAPDPTFPTTLKNNGARVRIVKGFSLGKLIDGEKDGQPSADASAEGTDDDGITSITPLIPGKVVQLRLLLSDAAGLTGRLDAWIDFNGNGTWADPGENIFSKQSLVPGDNLLTFTVPTAAKLGNAFARFRLSREGGYRFDGTSQPGGEIEDYLFKIETPVAGKLDYGDAPAPYPTLLSNNGSRHGITQEFHLGKLIDEELDGQPHSAALGDDASSLDDEDGVIFLTPLVPDKDARLEVIASTSGRLDAWIDFLGNGNWSDEFDRIVVSKELAPGSNLLSIHVPPQAKSGPTFARFRFSREGGLNFSGAAPIGEVEDYRVTIEKPSNCDLSCMGVDFWLAFPRNYAPDPTNPVKPSVCALGNPGAQVTVEIAGLNFTKTVAIPASGSVTIDLPKAADLGLANDIIESKGVHITSTSPIVVHGLSKVQYSSDGFLGIQTEALGNEYVVQSYSNVYTDVPELNGSQFALVATENDTTVTIVPSVVTQGHDSGFPYQIKMQRGQTYQLRNLNGLPADLAGTAISSDKPIGVFGSHACANVQSAALGFCDYLVEQLLPVKTWGVDYLTFPLKTRLNGDTYRVLAAYDETKVFINGVNVATLDRGESYQTLLTAAVRITASHPVHLTQYANSSDFDLVESADPFMLQVPHRGLFSHSQMFCTPATDFSSHFINIIAPAAAVSSGSVLLDGVAVSAGLFTAIGASGFLGSSVAVTAGSHKVTASLPIGVTVYGWGKYESYGWPACFFFGDTTPPVVNCPPTRTVDLNSAPTTTGFPACQTPVPDFRPQISFTDNCPRTANSTAGPLGAEVITQTPPPGTLVGPGDHEILIEVTDARGNTGVCVVHLIVIAPTKVSTAAPVARCPQDIVVSCVNNSGAVATFDAFVLVGCDVVPMESSPPSGSLFPVGTTRVTCRYNGVTPALVCTFTVTVTCPRIGLTRASQGPASITWSSSQTLQVSDTITGPWKDVPAGPSQTLQIRTDENPQKFYRVRD